ncbi:MAG TPA: hypothetical protein VLG69_05055, partial [Candidatus Andersenbacteria bacterium]|nr:hypothetical protein [Candidatus Andersenbacteria bacterium]
MRFLPINISIALFAGISIVLSFFFSAQTHERSFSSRTPDGIHEHQVYKNYPLTEEFTATARGLSAIGLFGKSNNPAQIVHIIVKNISSNFIISEQDIQVQNLSYISIPRQAASVGNRYSITIQSNADKAHAVKIAYQSDPTADPASIVNQAGVPKQGSLGLIEYERPTIALQFARWLAIPHQRALWAGIFIAIVGYIAFKKAPKQREKIKKARVVNPISFLLITLASIVIYWPATHLFFYSDDVPILVRVTELWNHQPLLLLTPHRYTDADPQSQFGFDFYRPISFSLYPLLLHLFVPLNAGIYYFLNILLFAGTACGLVIIGKRITKSDHTSFLLVLLWMSHSSKLGLLYWWSSVQDLLASFFALLTIVLYFKWKESLNKKILRLSLISFSIALFSKEYIIVTPFIIAYIELTQQHFSKKRFLEIIRNISPYIIVAGIFLVINTAILGDPNLPQHKQTDQTYSLSSNPINIVRNSIVYSSFTAEQRLWPQIRVTKSFENKLSNIFELWRLKTSGPYYPGVILFLTALVLILIVWRNKKLRNRLCIGYVWWLLYIAPFLLFTSDWRPRWLTLATFGSSLVL